LLAGTQIVSDEFPPACKSGFALLQAGWFFEPISKSLGFRSEFASKAELNCTIVGKDSKRRKKRIHAQVDF